MFCVQCEHTIRTPVATGCSYAMGMCGKTSEVSDLQDVLIYLLQGVSAYALKARTFGIVDRAIDAYVCQAFFATLTNVNFEAARITEVPWGTETVRPSIDSETITSLVLAGVPRSVSGVRAAEPPQECEVIEAASLFSRRSRSRRLFERPARAETYDARRRHSGIFAEKILRSKITGRRLLNYIRLFR